MRSSVTLKILIILSAVSGLIYIVSSVVIHAYLRNMALPESYIGMINLMKIRDYLNLYFWLNIADIILFSIFIILLCLMLIAIGKKLKFKICLVMIFVSVLGLLTLMDNQKNRFDFQRNANQYQGTILMQTYALLKDIEQDLQDHTTRTVKCIPKYNSHDFKYHIDGRFGGYDIHMSEYALYDSESDSYLSQISQQDYNTISENFCGYISHEFELYTHSGFLASVDHDLKIKTPDYENLFTISFEENTIYRTTHPEEENFKKLFLITIMDNKQEQCDALNWTEKVFPFSYDAKKYTAYLAISHHKKLVPVSNKISFSYDRYTHEFTFIE